MKPKNRLIFCATPLIIALLCSSAIAGKTHVHGVVKLNVAVETREEITAFDGPKDGSKIRTKVSDVSIALEMPLDSLLGFERAPRTDAERQSAASAVVKIRDAKALFQFDSRAECEQNGEVVVKAPVLEPLSAASRPDNHHGDLEATYRFTCRKPPFLGRLDVRLFEAFRRVKRIEVQAAGPKGQKKMVLYPSSSVLLWPEP